MHIGVVNQFGIPAAQGKAFHRNASTLKRQNLATNEAVADFGVLIDEIRDAHSGRFQRVLFYIQRSEFICIRSAAHDDR